MDEIKQKNKCTVRQRLITATPHFTQPPRETRDVSSMSSRSGETQGCLTFHIDSWTVHEPSNMSNAFRGGERHWKRAPELVGANLRVGIRKISRDSRARRDERRLRGRDRTLSTSDNGPAERRRSSRAGAGVTRSTRTLPGARDGRFRGSASRERVFARTSRGRRGDVARTLHDFR